MAVGIYGGNFDPIHIGHLITAQYVLEMRNLEKIIFIPANISPLKQNIKSLQGDHRMKMLRFAIERNKNFEVSPIELMRKGVSYTLDTIKDINKEYNEIELIVGFDNLLKFEKCHKPDEILKLCELIVLHRKVDSEPEEKNKYFDKAIILDTPTIEVSSTEIRERIKKRLPIDYLVPLKVKEYIYENGLYK